MSARHHIGVVIFRAMCLRGKSSEKLVNSLRWLATMYSETLRRRFDGSLMGTGARPRYQLRM